MPPRRLGVPTRKPGLRARATSLSVRLRRGHAKSQVSIVSITPRFFILKSKDNSATPAMSKPELSLTTIAIGGVAIVGIGYLTSQLLFNSESRAQVICLSKFFARPFSISAISQFCSAHSE